MIGLLPRLAGAAAGVVFLGGLLAFAWPKGTAEAIVAEPKDAGVDAATVERPCAAEGARPADYFPLRTIDDEPTVAELREHCLEQTQHAGVAHVLEGGTYTIVNCWTGKQDPSGFVYEDRNIWSRAVYVGP